MSVKLHPPAFSCDKSYERFKQELLAWREVTEIDKSKQGIVVALSLPENETGIREKVFDNIELNDLKKENGFEILVAFLDKQLGKDDLADCLGKFEEFEDYEREKGQSINDYISNFDQRYHKIVKKGMKLPEEILAFKLLKRAHITKEEKMLVLTGMDYSQKDNLFEQAKVSLKKFLGQQAGGGGNNNNQNSQQAMKVEPTFVASETFFTQYAGRSRGRSGNRRFMRGRGRPGGFRGKQAADRNMNPVGSNGKPLTCLSCGSFRHLIAQCPDSWENMSKVNYTMQDYDTTINEPSEPVVLFTGNIKDGLSQLSHDARYSAVLDSACSSTVCGTVWMESYLEILDDEDLEKIVTEDGVKVFRFGGGETLKSVGSYVIPACVAGKEIKIKTDVVDSDIPLLLSVKAMKDAKIKLDLENDSAEIFGEKVNLDYTSSGHYCIPIDKHDKTPVEEVNAVFLPQMNAEDRYKAVAKLHRQFAHPPEKKLVALLKDAGCWNNDYQETVAKVHEDCQLCKVYTRTPPRPVVALPMSRNFNETVAMDLKKWRNGWILHLVDMWSRLTISAYIHRKTPKEVIDKIMTHWVGAGFGVMQGILTDNGGEFSAEEMREVASILNVRVHTTAAESPFQNGLCERIHSVTDMMLIKMEEQCPQTPLDVLLCWANMARNALQMWHGFSSYQLVFGRNPNLPNIMTEQVPALDGITRSEVLAQHLNALHAARKSFMESEASEKIRRALRSKVRASEVKYSHGDLVYYKRENSDKWLGPGKVMFQDGKVIFIRHGGAFVRASPNRMIKTGLEFCGRESDKREQSSPVLRGEEFQTDPVSIPFEMCEGMNSESKDKNCSTEKAENCEKSIQKTVKSNDRINLCRDDRIKFRESEDDDFVNATVISRGGKVSGQYKNCFNVKFDDDRSGNVDLGKVDTWHRILPEEVMAVSVPKSRHEDDDCIQAKREELDKLKEFNTYAEIDDNGQMCISTRWVLCQKGDKVKARLVARGFEEEFDMERDSPTIGKSALRVFLTIAASQNWSVETTDIKSAFLQGKVLNRDVFITPPKEANAGDKIWKLNHCLYGLNDAARQFYQSVKEVLINLKCTQSRLDPALFFLRENNCLIGMIASHVDDFLHCGGPQFDSVIDGLVNHFQAGKKESGQFGYIGFRITQSKEEIILDQAEYVEDLEVKDLPPQRKIAKSDCLSMKEHTILRGLVGKLNWVVQGSRPDLAFEMIELSMKFKNGLVDDLLRAMKAIRKLKMDDAKVCFPNIGNMTFWKLLVFTDAAHANLCDGVSSVGAHLVFLMGDKSRCCPLAWHAGKIKRVVRSTIAAETLSLQEGIEEALYLRELLEGVTGERFDVCAYVDNKSVVEAIHSTKLVDDKRLRLDIAAVQQSLQCQEIQAVKWIPGQEQLANVMTKRGASNLQLLNVMQTGIMQMNY